MSYPSECNACMSGDHDRHEPSHRQPGLIGGTYCPCKGDCADRAQGVVDWLAARLAREAQS